MEIGVGYGRIVRYLGRYAMVCLQGPKENSIFETLTKPRFGFFIKGTVENTHVV